MAEKHRAKQNEMALEHPSYSPDLPPADFCLFGLLEIVLEG
jgi:hypothetical protein